MKYKYSEIVLKMLKKAVSGEIKDFWDFSFDFNALFGEDEEFSDAWEAENPKMFDFLNDLELIMFLEEHNTKDTEGFIKFLTPYYEKARTMVPNDVLKEVDEDE